MITSPSIWGALSDNANNNIYELVGSGAPTNGTAGTGVNIAGPGSTYTDVASKKVYVNTNTLASPTWEILAFTEKVSGSISSAAITGTVAGQLGHANGVVLQAAPAAGLALQPIALGLYYTFTTASYTAGGNVSLNYGAGGAAVTGVVSASNGIGAAASKAVMFFPLSTAAVPIVSAASLNLVAASAFTNPGTAAGTVTWELWYRTMNVGF